MQKIGKTKSLKFYALQDATHLFNFHNQLAPIVDESNS